MADFPFKAVDLTDELLLARFRRLQHYEFKLVNHPYTVFNLPPRLGKNPIFRPRRSPILIVQEDADYENYNLIADRFTEELRLRARRVDQPLTAIQYWEQNRPAIETEALRLLQVSSSTAVAPDRWRYALREAVYALYMEPTSFRPTLMSGFIRLFHAHRVLDISAGWGDRLIGALAALAHGPEGRPTVYCGVDPNSTLHPCYNAILRLFMPEIVRQELVGPEVLLIEDAFETAAVPERQYDLVLTSPPYFDLEVYSADDKQSIIRYPGFEAWLEQFLMTSLRKAWTLMAPGAHLVVFINNYRDGPDIVGEMLQRFGTYARLNDGEYLGCISHAVKQTLRNKTVKYKSPQPAWIWRKA